jgi:LysR family glycine cleavage system transcriptional activator
MLPPLNALRAFDAAARHLSVSRVAAELNVTPGAVSQHIRALEEWFGVPLFRRVPRGLKMTAAAERLHPRLAEGFELISEAVGAMDSRRDDLVLTVGVAPAIASKWLVPRLERFNSRHPDIDLRLSANKKLVDFRGDGFDAAIRFGYGRYGDMFVRKLFNDGLVPLCSPRLFEGDYPPKSPADLTRYPLLHDMSVQSFDADAPTWGTWFEAAGVTGADTSHGTVFDHAELALQAALNGAGVLLGRRMLAQADLDAGSFVMPFDLVVPFGLAYYFVCPPEIGRQEKAIRFLEWLEEEVEATLAGSEPLPFVEDRLPPSSIRQA